MAKKKMNAKKSKRNKVLKERVKAKEKRAKKAAKE